MNNIRFFVFSSILFLLQPILAKEAKHPICKNTSSVNEARVQLNVYRDKKLRGFANHRLIASRADNMLSKLISAKSKVLFGWISKRNLGSATETEIALKWRSYFAENFILARYPNKDEKINVLIEKMFDTANNDYLHKKLKSSYQLIFDEVKQASLKKIHSLPLSKKHKSQLKKRVGNIRLYWMKEFKKSKFTKQPLEFFSWGVAYDPVSNEINMGLRATEYPNNSTIAAVFAHEIGHSFDPCRWTAFYQGENPFKNVMSCLRSDRSVQAKKRDDSLLERFTQKKRISKDLALALKLHPYCNKLQYPPAGLQAEQLLESFADWFSAEVISETNYISTHLRSDLCWFKKLNDGSSYPSNKDRLEKIYLVQPEIRKRLQWKGASKYCPF